MTDEEKAEEFVKYSRCSLCFDFGRYDVCHKTCNCFTQDCYYFLAGLKSGRAESENEIAELKEQNLELKERCERKTKALVRLIEQNEKMKCCANCKHCVFKYDDEDLIFECDVTGMESYNHLKTCTNWELAE